MLPPIIIDQIKKREEEERRHRELPFVQLPIPVPQAPPRAPREEEESERGVVIIDLG